MVKIETHIYGIYPKTNDLRIKINRWERGRIETKDIAEILAKEKDSYYDLVKGAGINSFTDPLFNWYDILRPVALLSGAELGPLTRYKETNTFYRKPEFKTVEGVKSDPSKFGEIDSNPPLPLYHKSDTQGFSAFFPSPVTLHRMSEVAEGISGVDFNKKIVENYIDICGKFGATSITLFEAFEYGDEDLSFLDLLTKKFKVYLVTEGEIREQSFSSLSNKLHSIVSSDTDNARVSANFSKSPGLKLIDAHNTKLEESDSIKIRAEEIASSIGSETVVATNSDYMDFLPRVIADRKVEILSKVGA